MPCQPPGAQRKDLKLKFSRICDGFHAFSLMHDRLLL